MQNPQNSGTRPERFRTVPGKLFLDPASGDVETSELTGTFVVRPTRHSNGVPDDVYDTYSEIIENGALGRLYARPAQPWSQGEAATFFQSQYLDALNWWKSRASDEAQVGVPRRVKYGGL
jgi:hypothetical protein